MASCTLLETANEAGKMIVSHFYSWHLLPDCAIENLMAEFSWNGAEYLTITGHQLGKHIEEPAPYLQFFGRALCAQRLKTHDAHAPAGNAWDLNINDAEQRKKIYLAHSNLIDILSGMGVRTYTMHTGTRDYLPPYNLEIPPLRELAVDMLERLLPIAEKKQMILALENSFEATNAPDEIIALAKHFDSPWIRCCFDTGHAFRMAEGKDLALFRKGYIDESWHGEIKLEADAHKKMRPFVVTAHLHDNNGYSDQHLLAFCGRADWPRIIADLRDTPSLLSIQNEMNAFKHHIPIAKACENFRKIAAAFHSGL
jgi:sugar phosphate isomerase/epimerase